MSNRIKVKKVIEDAESLLIQMRAQRASRGPDPVEWAQTALGFDLDHWQKRIMRSDHPRLVVVAARQSGKSVVTGAKTAYEAATRPGLRVVTVAPSFRQAHYWRIRSRSASVPMACHTSARGSV